MNKIAAAKEIRATHLGMTGGSETVSLLKVWDEMGRDAAMSWENFSAGVKHLAISSDDVIVSPALYPWQYKQDELDAVVNFGGQNHNTLYIE